MSQSFHADHRQHLLSRTLLMVTAIMPFIGIIFAKPYAYIPAVTGLIFFLLFKFWAKAKITISKEVCVLIIAILALASLSLIWTQDFELSSEKVFKLALLLPPQILLISLFTSLKPEHIRPHIWIIPIGVIMGGLILIFETITLGEIFNIVRGGEDRPLPFAFSDLNRGGVTIALFAFIAYPLLAEKIKPVFAFGIIMVPAGLGILLTESQSAQLALIAGWIMLILFGVISDQGSKLLIRGIKYITILLTIALPFVMPQLNLLYLESLNNEGLIAAANAGHRLEIWDFIGRYIQDTLWIGNGIEVTRSIDDFESRQNYGGNGIYHPHNFALQIWLEFGLLGILIAVSFIYAFFTRIERDFDQAQRAMLMPVIIAAFVPASVAYALWQGLFLGVLFHIAGLAIMVANVVGSKSKS